MAFAELLHKTAIQKKPENTSAQNEYHNEHRITQQTA